jgi:hypothetical protein
MKALSETRNAIGYKIKTRTLNNAAIALEKKKAYQSEDTISQFDTNRRRETEAADFLKRQMEEDNRQRQEAEKAYRQQEAKEDKADEQPTTESTEEDTGIYNPLDSFRSIDKTLQRLIPNLTIGVS